MSSLPVPSALDARNQAFPVLTAAQISRIRSGSKVREVKKGEILFEPVETNVPFFVLLSGSMEIVQSDLAGERLIVTHGPGNFTGEMTMISGRAHSCAAASPSLVSFLNLVQMACGRWSPRTLS